MDGHERLRALGDAPLDVAGIEIERHRVDVGEHRRRTASRDRLGRRVERERRADHLVARADAHRVEHEDDRVGAVRAADRVGSAELLRGLALERLDLRAEDELAGLERARERLFQLGDQRRVLRLDVNVGDLHGGERVPGRRRRQIQYARSGRADGEPEDWLESDVGESTFCSGLRITENDPLIHIKAAAKRRVIFPARAVSDQVDT